MTDTTGTTGTPGTTQKTPARAARSRTAIFIYDLVVIAVLLIIGALYLRYPTWFDIGGPKVNLSIHCMWFGALGGIIISLKGVYDHAFGASSWNDNFNLWHIGRPVSGGVAGLMTFLLLTVVNPSDSPSEPIAYAAAFIFGTQEARFFGLLYEVARLIVHVPSEKAQQALTVASIAPAQGAAGTAIKIAGAGFDPNATATLGGAAIENLEVEAATLITGTAPARPAGADVVDLVVTNPDGASAKLPKAFRFTA